MKDHWKDFILPGASALAGALGQKSSSTSTYSNLPQWSPEYQTFNTQLLQSLQERLLDPSKGTEPLRINAIDAINRRYQALPQRLATNLASRGYGKSGALGTGIKGLEFARQGELGDLEAKMAAMKLGREDTSYDLAMRLLGMNAGQTGSATGEGTQGGGWSGALSGLMSGFGFMRGMGSGGASNYGPTNYTDLSPYYNMFGFR